MFKLNVLQLLQIEIQILVKENNIYSNNSTYTININTIRLVNNRMKYFKDTLPVKLRTMQGFLSVPDFFNAKYLTMEKPTQL